MLDTRQYGRDKQIQPFEYLQESGFKQEKFYNDLNSNNKNLCQRHNNYKNIFPRHISPELVINNN